MTLKERLTQPGNTFIALAVAAQIANLVLLAFAPHGDGRIRLTLSTAFLVLMLAGFLIRAHRAVYPRR